MKNSTFAPMHERFSFLSIGQLRFRPFRDVEWPTCYNHVDYVKTWQQMFFIFMFQNACADYFIPG